MKTQLFLTSFVIGLTACTPGTQTMPWVDLSGIDTPAAITETPWQEVVVGVPNFTDVPQLFTQIGGFETVSRNAASWVLRAPGADSGFIRFDVTPVDAPTTRPFGSRSWDTGCYFSIMMRAKNLPSIIEDAQVLGWVPLTKMAYLEFGTSQLNIIVLGHEKTGIQVQLYERLTTPLPDGFTPFERISRPFNIMQMVKSRDAAYAFYRQGLGFDNFYFGPPSVSTEPEIMPLGIPKALTTRIPYHAGIVTPKVGLEWGRMEMIQVDMPDGTDLKNKCQSGHIGITEVRFNVEDIEAVARAFTARGVDYQSEGMALRVQSPDGANIAFSQK